MYSHAVFALFYIFVIKTCWKSLHVQCEDMVLIYLLQIFFFSCWHCLNFYLIIVMLILIKNKVLLVLFLYITNGQEQTCMLFFFKNIWAFFSVKGKIFRILISQVHFFISRSH